MAGYGSSRDHFTVQFVAALLTLTTIVNPFRRAASFWVNRTADLIQETGVMATAPNATGKISREDVPADHALCDYCTAKCCRYFALPIDEPTTWRDFDYIRWYLIHGRATVFVEEESWYLMVHTVCKHLREDNRCGIYETRPKICREYTTDNCEYEDDWVYDHYFETPEQVEEYAEAILPNRDGKGIRGPKPNLLSIIN